MNCQLYSSWRLGTCKPGVVPDREGLVEAAGASIKVWRVRLCPGVGVSAGKGVSASVIDLSDEAF